MIDILLPFHLGASILSENIEDGRKLSICGIESYKLYTLQIRDGK